MFPCDTHPSTFSKTEVVWCFQSAGYTYLSLTAWSEMGLNQRSGSQHSSIGPDLQLVSIRAEVNGATSVYTAQGSGSL